MADATILSWITAEVDQALEHVRDSIAKFSASPDDTDSLSICPEHLHQVSGALRMVGLSGATRFCEAIEGSFSGANGSRPSSASIVIIDRAVLALKQFVDDVARGQANVPLRLFPVYRELAKLQGKADSSEKELFFPDLTPPAPSPQPLDSGKERAGAVCADAARAFPARAAGLAARPARRPGGPAPGARRALPGVAPAPRAALARLGRDRAGRRPARCAATRVAGERQGALQQDRFPHAGPRRGLTGGQRSAAARNVLPRRARQAVHSTPPGHSAALPPPPPDPGSRGRGPEAGA